VRGSVKYTLEAVADERRKTLSGFSTSAIAELEGQSKSGRPGSWPESEPELLKWERRREAYGADTDD
jgi:hypothetical protein